MALSTVAATSIGTEALPASDIRGAYFRSHPEATGDGATSVSLVTEPDHAVRLCYRKRTDESSSSTGGSP